MSIRRRGGAKANRRARAVDRTDLDRALRRPSRLRGFSLRLRRLASKSGGAFSPPSNASESLSFADETRPVAKRPPSAPKRAAKRRNDEKSLVFARRPSGPSRPSAPLAFCWHTSSSAETRLDRRFELSKNDRTSAQVRLEGPTYCSLAVGAANFCSKVGRLFLNKGVRTHCCPLRPRTSPAVVPAVARLTPAPAAATSVRSTPTRRTANPVAPIVARRSVPPRSAVG
jgi:hypothetical protein